MRDRQRTLEDVPVPVIVENDDICSTSADRAKRKSPNRSILEALRNEVDCEVKVIGIVEVEVRVEKQQRRELRSESGGGGGG